MAAVAREVGVDTLVNVSQMTVSQMSARECPGDCNVIAIREMAGYA